MKKHPEAIRRSIVAWIMKALLMKKTHLTWSGERGKKKEVKEAHPQTEAGISEGGVVACVGGEQNAM